MWQFTEYRGRTQECLQRIASEGSSGAATPPHLRYATPEPDTWGAKRSAEFLQNHAKEVEAYKERSKGASLHDKSSTNSVPRKDGEIKDFVVDTAKQFMNS